MAFFTSDMELGEAFGNPKPSQAYQPTVGAGPLAGARAVGGDPLSLFAQAISQGARPQGLGSGMNLSDVGKLDFGGIGTTGGTGTGDWLGQPGSPDATMPWMPSTGQQPVYGGDDSFPGDDGSLSFMDNTDYFGNQLPGLQSYLMSKEQTPPWKSYLASSLVPGFGMLSTAADIGYGINPFYGTFLGDVFDAAPTFDWYEGSTDAFGHAMSDAALESQYGGYANVFEQMAAEQDDLDALMDLMEESFNFDNEVITEPTPAPVPDVVHTVAPRDETVVEPTGWAGDISAGGYTWDSDDWGSVEEAQEETGIGTSEWDSSHADFSWDDDDSGGDSGGGDSGGGGSYIATAATQALGEKGLKVFEDWRDYMFTALPTFTTSYGRYRVTAPKIVKVIDSKNNSNNIYTWIWDMHLKPIFDMIKEDKDSKKALKDYKIMVKDLQDKFLKEK